MDGRGVEVLMIGCSWRRGAQLLACKVTSVVVVVVVGGCLVVTASVTWLTDWLAASEGTGLSHARGWTIRFILLSVAVGCVDV